MRKLFIIILLVCMQQIDAQYSKIFDFAGAASGATPQGNLISDGTFLYGMVAGGGVGSNGIIFRIKPDGTLFSNLHDFGSIVNDGAYSKGTLIFDGTFLYGMTEYGGSDGYGIIFKIKPNGNSYDTLMTFKGANGAQPKFGSLYFDGTFLYGMTAGGGSNSSGVLFKIKPNGTGYSLLHDFGSGADGINPYSSLISDGTFLYGMTAIGGTHGVGTIFKIKPNGTGYDSLYCFGNNIVDGNTPYGSLVYDGNFLYGMTSLGGVYGAGTIFKIKPNGTGYLKLMDFEAGNTASGDLIFNGTFLYGMEFGGGNPSYYGNIFQIKTDGSGYTDLHDFGGVSDGQNPYGSLFLNTGCLYGMTSGGGVNGDGVMFGLCGIANGIEKLPTINGNVEVYPNPTSDQFFIDVNTTDKLHLDLYDASGRHVLSKSVSVKSNVDVTTLNEGVYTLSIKMADLVINKKLIIIR